jgi:glycerol-3-phosphate dehydrogenase
VSRGFALMDHCDQGVDNLLTITGGKLTTFRLMAEKAADLICERLGVTATCSTHAIPLPEADGADWTEPGRAPRLWLQQQDPDDLLLCECEMVPQKAVDSIVQTALKNRISPDLRTIGLRSRIGKGACQGTFCSTRVLAYLHELGVLAEDQGLYQLPEFLDERWRGQRCIFWDGQLIQAELQEALHCGLFSLELNTPRAATTTQESEESHEEG